MAAAGNRPSLQGNASTVFLKYRVILGCARIPSIHSRVQGVGLRVPEGSQGNLKSRAQPFSV